MQGYADKRALIAEVEKTAALFIDEFAGRQRKRQEQADRRC